MPPLGTAGSRAAPAARSPVPASSGWVQHRRPGGGIADPSRLSRGRSEGRRAARPGLGLRCSAYGRRGPGRAPAPARGASRACRDRTFKSERGFGDRLSPLARRQPPYPRLLPLVTACPPPPPPARRSLSPAPPPAPRRRIPGPGRERGGLLGLVTCRRWCGRRPPASAAGAARGRRSRPPPASRRRRAGRRRRGPGRAGGRPRPSRRRCWR